MSVANACRDSFARSTMERGRDYVGRGRVEIVHTEDGLVGALVSGSRKDPYHVVIDWTSSEKATLAAGCDCPHYADGVFCKHIWATLLKMDAEGIGARLTARHRRLRLVHDDEDDEGDTYDDFDFDDDLSGEHGDEFFTPAPHLAHQPARRSLQAARAPLRRDTVASPSWRDRLRELAGPSAAASQPILTLTSGAVSERREVWFILDVAESRRAAALTVELRQRQRTKTGTLGKLQHLGIRYGEIPQWVSAQDRELIEILVGHRPQGIPTYGYYGQGSYARATIVPAMHAMVLPRLCATGRFVAANAQRPLEEPQALRWDDGEPWRFRLSVECNDARKCWLLIGRLQRAEETAALDDAVLLLAHGVVVFADRVARLDARREFPWITLLRRESAIEIPYGDRDAFLEGLYGLSHLPALELPKGLRVADERLQPRGRLEIAAPKYPHGSSRRLLARVAFEYGKQQFALDDPRRGRFDPASKRAVVRDAEREKLLVGELSAAGLKLSRTFIDGREALAFELDERHLPDVVRGLAESGWTVYARGARIRQAGAFNITVTSGLDWFDLEAAVDFEGVSAPLPVLLKALRQGESYVRLDDGSQGMLPQAWLERYGALARLAGASPDGEAAGSLRFARSQALLLDVLLAEQENVRVDGRYAALRDKLRSFRGVEAIGEPRGFEGVLRNYQKEGHGWLHFLREFGFGGCLADDMGLGKTVQVLALLQSRRNRRLRKGEERRPSIVVVPRSLVFNWIDEAKRFTPALRVLDYSGADRHARLSEAGRLDLMVTTYGTLRRDVAELKDMRFDYAILDEAQAIKNHASLASKASRLICADHRLAMSGTPVENHLGELWSLFEFLNPGMLGSAKAFADLAKRSRGAEGAIEPFARAMRPFLLRRTKQAVLSELPEKTEQTLYCELSPAERRQYDELRDHFRVTLQRRVREIGMNRAKIHVLEALLRLRQAACHPGLLDREKAGEMSAKLETLLGQLDEVVAEGHKVLVFSQFTSLLAIVRRQLDKAGVTYEYLDGQTRDRAQKVRRFQQDASCPLFLISLKAGGHGLNLTAADYVFILDPWWNPAVEAQAVDRAHRIGQTRRVFAYRIISRDTVEDKIVELQATKRALADAIVSADEGLIQRLTVEDLELLLGE